jgi:hypothetical protein
MNSTGIMIVVLRHVLVAYGIVTGLGKRMVTKMAEAVETRVIGEKAPPPPQTPSAIADWKKPTNHACPASVACG